MGQQADPRKTPPRTPEREEKKSYAPSTPQGADTDIAADDAGATAMAERAQEQSVQRSEGLENDG